MDEINENEDGWYKINKNDDKWYKINENEDFGIWKMCWKA